VRSLEVLDYLKAKSLLGLRRLMVRNNARFGVTFNYFDIQFVKGHWHAFYYARVQDQDPLFTETGES
jgi:hypothetical protein